MNAPWVTEKEEQILQMLQQFEDYPPHRWTPRLKTIRELSEDLRHHNSSPNYQGVIGWERSGVQATLRRLLAKGWVAREPLKRVHRNDPAWLWTMTEIGRDALHDFYERDDAPC